MSYKGGTSTSAQGEGAEKIDVTKWLEQNKLEHISNIFQEKSIVIEELIEFNDEELKDFAKDIGLNVLERKRFIKGIAAIRDSQPKQQQGSQGLSQIDNLLLNSDLSQFSVQAIKTKPQSIGPSKDEQSAFDKLLSRIKSVNELIYKIEGSLKCSLDESIKSTQTLIHGQISSTFEEMEKYKVATMAAVDRLKKEKLEILKQQLFDLKDYLVEIEKAQLEYNEIVFNKNLKVLNEKGINPHSIRSRRNYILSMVEDILKKEKMVFRTKPTMKFEISKEDLLKFYAMYTIDKFDSRYAMEIKTKKITDRSFQIHWELELPTTLALRNVVSFEIDCCEVGLTQSQLKKLISKNEITYEMLNDDEECMNIMPWVSKKLNKKTHFPNVYAIGIGSDNDLFFKGVKRDRNGVVRAKYKYHFVDMKSNCNYAIRVRVGLMYNTWRKGDWSKPIIIETKQLIVKNMNIDKTVSNVNVMNINSSGFSFGGGWGANNNSGFNFGRNVKNKKKEETQEKGRFGRLRVKLSDNDGGVGGKGLSGKGLFKGGTFATASVLQQRPHPAFEYSKRKNYITMTWDRSSYCYNYRICLLDMIIDSTNEVVPTFRYKLSNKLSKSESKSLQKKHKLKCKLEDRIFNIEYLFEVPGGGFYVGFYDAKKLLELGDQDWKKYSKFNKKLNKNEASLQFIENCQEYFNPALLSGLINKDNSNKNDNGDDNNGDKDGDNQETGVTNDKNNKEKSVRKEKEKKKNKKGKKGQQKRQRKRKRNEKDDMENETDSDDSSNDSSDSSDSNSDSESDSDSDEDEDGNDKKSEFPEMSAIGLGIKGNKFKKEMLDKWNNFEKASFYDLLDDASKGLNSYNHSYLGSAQPCQGAFGMYCYTGQSQCYTYCNGRQVYNQQGGQINVYPSITHMSKIRFEIDFDKKRVTVFHNDTQCGIAWNNQSQSIDDLLPDMIVPAISNTGNENQNNPGKVRIRCWIGKDDPLKKKSKKSKKKRKKGKGDSSDDSSSDDDSDSGSDSDDDSDEDEDSGDSSSDSDESDEKSGTKLKFLQNNSAFGDATDLEKQYLRMLSGFGVNNARDRLKMKEAIALMSKQPLLNNTLKLADLSDFGGGDAFSFGGGGGGGDAFGSQDLIQVHNVPWGQWPVTGVAKEKKKSKSKTKAKAKKKVLSKATSQTNSGIRVKTPDMYKFEF